jgi:hypothetical protein
MALNSTLPPSNTISPSVRITEIDDSLYSAAPTFHTSGLVGFASKGPVGLPTQITSQAQLTSIFGYPHPEVGDPYLIYAAQQYLTIANQLWIVRVADTSPTSWESAGLALVDVLSSGGQVLVESEVTEGISAWAPETADTPANTIPAVHATGNYSFNYDSYFSWKLNGNLASRVLQILANNNRLAPLTGLVYTADQLAGDLNAQLVAGDGIEFWVDPTELPGQRKISVFATNSFGPSSSIEFVSVMNMACGGPTVADGGTNVLGFGTEMTRATVTSIYDGYPSTGSLYSSGNWDFTSLGSSTDLQLQVVITGTDSVSIDNVVQVIDLSSLQGAPRSTAEVVHAINTYITNNLPGGFQAVGGNAGGVSGSLPVDDLHNISPKNLSDSTLTPLVLPNNISLITNTFGEDAQLFVKPVSSANAFFGFPNVTSLGTSPTTYSGTANAYEGGIVLGAENSSGEVTFTITADSVGIDGNNTAVQIVTDPVLGSFSMYVTNNGSQVESWGSLTKDITSRFYVETFISIVSDWIRVLDTSSVPAAPASGTYSLSGGSDGIPADPDDQDSLLIGDLISMTGMYALSDPEQVDIDLMAVPGHSSSNVMQALISVCANQRMDCMAIIDPPFGLTVSEIILWHNGQHPLNDVQLNSDVAALYWPWLKMTDTFNQVDVWVPPSGAILYVYANNDSIAAPWFAPAGLNRGMLPSTISDVFDRPTLAERDLMYGWSNAVNPIIQFSDVSGFVVWGQKTLQRLPTALDRVNVRRMMFVAEKEIRAGSRYLLFEPNDALFQAQFTTMTTSILESIKSGRGLYDYLIIDDSSINTPATIDRNEFWAQIGIQPTKAVEFMYLEFSIHNTGSWATESTTF